MRLSLDWIGWDLHCPGYTEFPDPYQPSVRSDCFHKDNEAAVPRRGLSHWQGCQSPEIVWENSGWKKANCFSPQDGEVDLMEVASISYPEKQWASQQPEIRAPYQNTAGSTGSFE